MAGTASLDKLQVALKEKKLKISVIIPTMNEPAISSVVADVRKALGHLDAEIIVVDKSVDETASRAEKSGAVVISQENSGYGDAYMTGFDRLPPNTDVIVMMDGDNTYDAYEIPLLIDPIVNGRADICLGNRFARMEQGAMNSRNLFGNKVITYVINTLYRLRLNDSQTGFRAIKKAALDELEMTDNGMPFASEMIIDARKKSMSIAEVPITYRQRVGDAKLKAYKDGSLILSLIIRMVRDYNPFAIFLTIGALLMLGAIVCGGIVVYEWWTTHQITRLALTILTAMLFMSSIQIISFGLLADIILRAVRTKR